VEQCPVIAGLPDPFLMLSGKRVSSPAEWLARRDELKDIISFYEYGHLAPGPANVTAADISTTSIYNGTATEKVVRLAMGPAGAITFNLNLFIPAGSPGPFPVVLTGDLSSGSMFDKGGWGASEFVNRGYVIAEFDRNLLDPDQNNAVGACQAAYPGYDWATLAVWAWGYSRVVDYFMKAGFIDTAKIAVTGHSRCGKACLLAGAFDERVALTAPNCSGCGGVSAFRFDIGVSTAENLKAITTSFPYWFHPRLSTFADKETQLPFDQHELIALVAPRAFLTTNALDDAWANPSGAQRTQAAAGEVFGWLGASQKTGIHFRPGPHDQNHEDWQALIDFADRVLLGKTVNHRFDSLAYSPDPKGYTWTAPAPLAASTPSARSAEPFSVRVKGVALDIVLPADSRLTLKLYDLRGRFVQSVFDGMHQAGVFAIAIPCGLAPGAYLLMCLEDGRQAGAALIVGK
jgi:endo-1,4-beta-xylanase